MTRQQPRGGKRRHVWIQRARVGLVSLLAGCQSVPAHFVSCAHPDCPRHLIALSQIAEDTALETARHPVRSTSGLIIEPFLGLRGVTAGLHKRALKFAPLPMPIEADRPKLDPDSLEGELRRVAGDELQPANIELLIDNTQALAALEEAFDHATCQIDILMYLWENDPIGWEIAHRLAARASPTLRVRVLVDGSGNLLQGEPHDAGAGEVNAVVCWLAQQPHVQVLRTRNPFFRFDHRKFVLIDGRLVWSGGRNFNRESFRQAHDLSYLLTGPLTSELATRYERFWLEQGGPPGPPPPPALPAPEPNAQARLVRTRPYESNLAHTVYAAVDRACHHIYLENPYFTDNQLIVKLIQARRRGVDVRVVLTLKSGNCLTDIANRITANRLLRAGIRVYIYPEMTHVKALSVDGLWAYIGTGNFDSLSLRHNRELGVAVSHGPLIGTLEERLFLTDFHSEWEISEPLPISSHEFPVEVFTSLFL